METLRPQFRDALSNIDIGEKRDRAVRAHEEIQGILEADAQLCRLGIDPVVIGSYARRTGIYPGKDVDVFARLQRLDTSGEPQFVYDAVRNVLVAHYGDRATPQPRSIKIEFESDGFAVDAVPAVRFGGRWAIPTRDREIWTRPDDRWVETDPEELGRLTSRLNEQITVGSQGAYVPTVKLMRQARRHQLGDAKPGGFYFELLTYWAFYDGAAAGSSFAEIFASALSSVTGQLRSGEVVTDPVLDRPYSPAPDEDAVASAAAVFERLAADADDALSASRCSAAVIWRQILGDNERAPQGVFPIPDGCDETGATVPSVVGAAAVGSKEAGGFG